MQLPTHALSYEEAQNVLKSYIFVRQADELIGIDVFFSISYFILLSLLLVSNLFAVWAILPFPQCVLTDFKRAQTEFQRGIAAWQPPSNLRLSLPQSWMLAFINCNLYVKKVAFGRRQPFQTSLLGTSTISILRANTNRLSEVLPIHLFLQVHLKSTSSNH